MIDPPLTDVEARILGALVEKEVTTPDTYPLSLSGLTAACNQTTNRDPVMRLDEDTVTQSVVALRRRSLLRAIQPAGSRVTKYEHLMALPTGLNLDVRELAVVSVLLLRGPQTLAELLTRTTRLADFADLAAVEATLDALIAQQPEPLVVRLARRPGQKELRYAHLLSGEPAADAGTSPAPAAAAPVDDDRIATLERTVESLRGELADLRAELAAFRAQFQ